MFTQLFRRVCAMGLGLGLGLVLVIAALPALAGPLRISIDTAPLQSQGGFIAFDFVAGNPASGNTAGNTAVVSSFFSNATLGASTSTGDALGGLLPGPPPVAGPTSFLSFCSTQRKCPSPPPTPAVRGPCSMST